LSFEKLKTQGFSVASNIVQFHQPSDVVPDGLCDNTPVTKPTLVIENVNGTLVVKETEYTRQYLCGVKNGTME